MVLPGMLGISTKNGTCLRGAKRAVSWVAAHELWLLLPAVLVVTYFQRASVPVLLFVLLLWLCRLAARGSLSIRTPLDLPIIALTLATLVGLYPSADLGLSWVKLTGMLLGVSMFYALANNIRTETQIRLASIVLCASGGAVALVSLVGTDWAANKLFYLPQLNQFLPRLTTLMPQSALPVVRQGLHPNEVGGTLAMLFPIPLALFLWSSKGRVKGFLGVVLGTMGLVLLLTQSRSALAGLLVALLVLFIWRKRWVFVVLPLLLLGTILVAQIVGVDNLKEVFLSVDIATTRTNLMSSESRIEIWRRALYAIEDFPYTGIGINTFPFVLDRLYPDFGVNAQVKIPHAHNIFLQTAVDLGIPGLLAFLGLLACCLWMVRRVNRAKDSTRVKPLVMGLSCGLIAYLAYGLTDTIALSAKASVFLWAVLGLLSSTLSVCVVEKPTTARKRITSRARGIAGWMSVAALILSLFFLGRTLIANLYLNLANIKISKALAADRTASAGSPELGSSIRLLEQALAWGSEDSRTYAAFGRVYAREGAREKAIDSFRRAAELDPGNPILHFELGKAYEEAGMSDAAVEEWRQVGAFEYFFTKGKTHEIRGTEWEQAIAAYRTAARISPSDPVVQVRLGWSLLSEGFPAKARTAFQRALELDPEAGSAYVGMGEIFRAAGEYDKALSYYQRAVPLESPQEAAAEIGLAKIALGKGDLLTAAGDLKVAVSKDPESSVAYSLLGGIYGSWGELDQAIASYERAVYLAPQRIEPHLELASLYLRMGRTDDAANEYRQVLLRDPSNSQAAQRLQEIGGGGRGLGR